MWHSTKTHKYLIISPMINRGLILCASCVNKQKKDNFGKDKYYGKVVDGIIPNGIVWFDTDATKCIKDGVLKRIKE